MTVIYGYRLLSLVMYGYSYQEVTDYLLHLTVYHTYRARRKCIATIGDTNTFFLLDSRQPQDKNYQSYYYWLQLQQFDDIKIMILLDSLTLPIYKERNCIHVYGDR